MNPHLSFTEICTLASCAAILVGFSKTALPGLGILVVPLMVLLWAESKVSVGALLPMLIVGDIFAIRYYRRHADWKVLWGLVPWVVVGIGIGYGIGFYISDETHKLTIGVIVLLMVFLEGYRQLRGLTNLPRTMVFTAATGVAAGIATQLANAAGPVMGIYFLSIGFKKEEFMGTGAWYFLLLNLFKVPLFLSTGQINVETLTFDLCVAPVIVLGALIGSWAHPKISQAVFSRAVLVLAILGASVIIYKGVNELRLPPPAAVSTPGERQTGSPASMATPPASTLRGLAVPSSSANPAEPAAPAPLPPPVEPAATDPP